jgi:biotin carboxylase
MARILILMSTRTYRAEAFLKAGRALGLDVTVGTEIEQPVALLNPGASLTLNLRHPRQAQRQIVEFARDYPLAAIVGVDDDTILAAAMACEALGLPHNSVESVKASRYKDVMRLALSEAGLNTPKFELVGVDEDARSAAGRVLYPCVLKPLSLSASRGVVRADNQQEFVDAFQQVVDILNEADLEPDDPGAQQVLVESFIPGQEFALEGLLTDGHLTVLALFDKPDPLDGPYFEETIYVTPSRLPEAAQQAIVESTTKAATALGLRQGPIHAEVRLNEHGPWVVEVAARSLGGLCSNSLRFDFGLSLEEIILRHAAGLEIASPQRERRPAGVMMIPIPGAGILYAAHGQADAKAVPGIEEITISIPLGQEVVPLPRATRYLGFIIARAETPAAVEAALREAHRRLKFDIRPIERTEAIG